MTILKPATVPSTMVIPTASPATVPTNTGTKSPATMPTPSTTMSFTPSTSRVANDHADVPIFLRKTYHMIDTCEATIACWSDDGETFVIKDPVKFERTIIPQFFKHSKFSSFVRQLNFYSFRKIKYADTIRIDPKLEAETANYWRFRHERFRRGHPEWLTEIKRMNGQKNKVATATPVVSGSGSTVAKVTTQELQLQTEVSTLKKRIEDMTKNIDSLTTMVQKVSIQQKDQVQAKPVQAEPTDDLPHKNKKSKIDGSTSVPDDVLSAITSPSINPLASSATATPAVSSSTTAPIAMDVDPVLAPPSIPSPVHSGSWERGNSVESDMTDEGFVDTLFTAFKTEDFDFTSDLAIDAVEVIPAAPVNNSVIVQAIPAPPEPETVTSSLSSLSSSSNRPKPELMRRLGDALSVLPGEIQELIVDRLVQSITGPMEIQESLAATQVLAASETNKTAAIPTPPAASVVPPLKVQSSRVQNSAPMQSPMPISLAAATLAALLAQYGNSPAVAAAAVAAAASKSCMDVANGPGKSNPHKSLPVISAHA